MQESDEGVAQSVEQRTFNPLVPGSSPGTLIFLYFAGPNVAELRCQSAYIHVPFCRRRCGYCNFTLVAGRDHLADLYLDCLEAEIDAALLTTRSASPPALQTCYLGGGTPSHLTAPQLDRLLSLIRTHFAITEEVEFTCEVNPLDCTDEKLRLLRDMGVNRLSIGGQSFDVAKLRTLERDHTPEELRQAICRSARYFENLSCDLIFAAPGERLADWIVDIETATKLPLRHLSAYGLTIEKGSPFFGRLYHGQLAEVEETDQLAMYLEAIDVLVSAGYLHYEVSSFAKQGYASRHNETYWLGRSWWGFGPGAAAFVDGVRSVNCSSTTQYIKRIKAGQDAVQQRETLSQEQRIRERVVFGLRRMEGIHLRNLTVEFGFNIEPMFQPHLDQFIEAGWLERNGELLRLTRDGLVISDSLWPSLLVS